MNDFQNNGRKKLTPREELALLGFGIASKAVGGYVSPSDAFHALAISGDPNIGMIGTSLDMPDYAETLNKKGYLERKGDEPHVLYKPKDNGFKEQITQQA